MNKKFGKADKPPR